MNEHTCERVRDRLPQYREGDLDVRDATAVRAHLAECAECRAEIELIGLLQTPVSAPADLEARVIAAVRAHAPMRRPVRSYAIAATFAVAVITGSLLWPRGPGSGTTEPGDIAVAPHEEGELLLRGPGLTSLSEEELESLLKELGS